MSTPERVIFEEQEISSYGLISPEIDPLAMAVAITRELRAAGLSAYIPIKGAEPATEHQVIRLDDFRSRVPTPEKPDEEAFPPIPTQDPLRARLVEARKARNAEPDTFSSVRSQSGQNLTADSMPAVHERTLNGLFERSEKGDARATEQLVERFMPLARKLALKYAGRNELTDDLVQVANIGLFKAIKRFDRFSGHAFSSFAVPTIDGELKRHFRDHGWGTHVVRGLQETALKVAKAADKLRNENMGQDCTVQQVADELDIPYEDALEAWQALNGGYILPSLDKPLSSSEEDDNLTFGDTLPSASDEDSIINQVAYNIEVGKILGQTSLRDREIFVRHVLLDQTQTETAAATGVSQMQVSRITRRIKNGDYYGGQTKPRKESEPAQLPPATEAITDA